MTPPLTLPAGTVVLHRGTPVMLYNATLVERIEPKTEPVQHEKLDKQYMKAA